MRVSMREITGDAPRVERPMRIHNAADDENQPAEKEPTR
jgi:hypothetical protein